MRDLFLLDPDWTHLNHGGFGACPKPVFAEYQRWQREVERQPTDFLERRAAGLLDAARHELAGYVRADEDGLLFVPNVTTAVNAVARSLRLEPGDQVLATDHEYGPLDLMWRYLAERAGFDYVRRPFDGVDSFWAGAGERTRVLFVSHIASSTAVHLPVAELCRRARAAGVVSIVDGAHAPGHVPVDLAGIGADFYAGNCHKWLCAPKGSAFLSVAEDQRDALEPLVVSWGWAPEAGFVERHRWQGTRDPAAYLAVPAALAFQREHDWDEVRLRCRRLLSDCVERLGLEPVDPGFVQMVSLRLPECDPAKLWRRLREEHRIEAPCLLWNEQPLLRISVQGYNTEDDLRRLEAALGELL